MQHEILLLAKTLFEYGPCQWILNRGALSFRLCREADFKSPYDQSLRAAFKNPSSPFYIPPGETGPASPDEPPKSSESIHPAKQGSEPVEQSMSMEEAAGAAREALVSMGYDANSFWEQSITWGHHDAFRQVYCIGDSVIPPDRST